jgi:hypothetical protein
MRWMVVTTTRGQVLNELDVSEEQLVDVVSTWVRALPDADIYLDGQRVPQEARLLMLAAASPAAATTQVAAPPPEPEKLRSYAEVLQLGFDDLRKGYVASLNDMHDCAKRFGEMWLERERQFAEEAARQRELTHKSLKDADLLGRSVAAAQFKNVFAAAGSHTLARAQRQNDGWKWSDLATGLMRTLMGEPK